jgi:YMGG-like Gly-zipper
MLRKILSLALVLTSIPSAMGQQRTTQGAAVGGATGAIIGGIIGHQNDETPEGALIGGAVGAIAGGLLGRAQDNELQRQRAQQQAYQQHYYYQQQRAIASTGVSVADVVAMSRSGVSEPLIMSHLQSKGVQRRLEVSEIISLHQQGVSDSVISMMQSAPLASQLAAPVYTSVPAPRQQVIVHEQPVIYSSPVVHETYYVPAPRYHHHHYYRPPNNSIRIGF